MLRTELLANFTRVRLGLATVVKSFPEGRIEEPLFGEWSMREMVSHINGWDILTARCLQVFAQGLIPVWAGTVEEINLQSIADRSALRWSLLVVENRLAGQRVIAAYNQVSSADWTRPIWPDRPEITPEQQILEDIQHYGDEHLPQIVSAF